MVELSHYLTVAEVAEILGVSKITVRRWGDQGFLHPLRTPGSHRRFLKSEVLALYQRNKPLIELAKQAKEMMEVFPGD